MRSLAWWPCMRLVLSNSLPPPAMQDPTHAKISTSSRKGKEEEPVQMDISDVIIAERLQANVRVTLNIPSSFSPIPQPASQLCCPL